jgi:radical SAM domain protein
MKTLYVVTTNQCQLRCPFCYINFVEDFDKFDEIPEDKVSHIDTDMVYNVIKKGRYDTVVFHGGEPLLYPNTLLEIIQKCKGMGIDFSIQSNLAFKNLSQRQLEVISVCGGVGTSYNYDRFEGYPTQEEYFKSNIRELKSLGLGVSILITITENHIYKQNPIALKDYIDGISTKIDSLIFERVILPLEQLENETDRLEGFYMEADKYMKTCYEIFPREQTNLYNLVKNSITYGTPFYNTECSSFTHTLYPDKLKYGCPSLEKRNVDDSKKMAKCLECSWFKWCGGDCECFNHVCAFPVLLFERVIKDLKQELKEDTLNGL